MVSAKKSQATFGDAMAELEEILRRIEGEEIDIDELASELKKASELLELCREKIRRAEVEVTQIVQSIDAEDADEDEEEDLSPEGEDA